MIEKLKLLPRGSYVPAKDETDPLRFYYWPIFGRMYRRRVELALTECVRGQRVLEVGYGSGVSFINLSEKYAEVHGIDLFTDTEANTSFWKQQGINAILRNGNLLDLPYQAETFDTVLLISILEHLKVVEQATAMKEVHRVLKPGGQMVYGVPVERPLMETVFGLLGSKIREHHFSTEKDVFKAASAIFSKKRLIKMNSGFPFLGQVYEVGNFIKA